MRPLPRRWANNQRERATRRMRSTLGSPKTTQSHSYCVCLTDKTCPTWAPCKLFQYRKSSSVTTSIHNVADPVHQSTASAAAPAAPPDFLQQLLAMGSCGVSSAGTAPSSVPSMEGMNPMMLQMMQMQKSMQQLLLQQQLMFQSSAICLHCLCHLYLGFWYLWYICDIFILEIYPLILFSLLLKPV